MTTHNGSRNETRVERRKEEESVHSELGTWPFELEHAGSVIAWFPGPLLNAGEVEGKGLGNRAMCMQHAGMCDTSN